MTLKSELPLNNFREWSGYSTPLAQQAWLDLFTSRHVYHRSFSSASLTFVCGKEKKLWKISSWLSNMFLNLKWILLWNSNLSNISFQFMRLGLEKISPMAINWTSQKCLHFTLLVCQNPLICKTSLWWTILRRNFMEKYLLYSLGKPVCKNGLLENSFATSCDWWAGKTRFIEDWQYFFYGIRSTFWPEV